MEIPKGADMLVAMLPPLVPAALFVIATLFKYDALLTSRWPRHSYPFWFLSQLSIWYILQFVALSYAAHWAACYYLPILCFTVSVFLSLIIVLVSWRFHRALRGRKLRRPLPLVFLVCGCFLVAGISLQQSSSNYVVVVFDSPLERATYDVKGETRIPSFVDDHHVVIEQTDFDYSKGFNRFDVVYSNESEDQATSDNLVPYVVSGKVRRNWYQHSSSG